MDNTTEDKDELFICRRKVGGGDEGTRYFYYEEIEPYTRAAPLPVQDKEGADLLRLWKLVKDTSVQEYDPIGKNSGLLFKNHKTGNFAFLAESDVNAIESALTPKPAEGLDEAIGRLEACRILTPDNYVELSPGLYQAVDDIIAARLYAYGPAPIVDLESIKSALLSARNRIEYLSGFCDERHDQGNTHFFHLIDEAMKHLASRRLIGRLEYEAEGEDWIELTEAYDHHRIERDHPPIETGSERLFFHTILDFLASQKRLIKPEKE